MNALLRQYVVGECRFVAQKMSETSSDKDAIYYFSAVWAAAQRAFNIEYSGEMLLLHIVSHWIHQVLDSRTRAGDTLSPVIPEGLLNKIAVTTGEIANRIEQEKDFRDLLEVISQLGYIATGNGYYLYQEGKLE